MSTLLLERGQRLEFFYREGKGCSIEGPLPSFSISFSSKTFFLAKDSRGSNGVISWFFPLLLASKRRSSFAKETIPSS